MWLTYKKNYRYLRILPIFILLSLLTEGASYAQVSGRVFQDLPVNGSSANVYGLRQANELDVEGITVTVYPGAHTTTTNDMGNWSFSAAQVSGAARVEFSGWPSYLYPSPDAQMRNTSVRFVNAGDTDVNFGLHDPGLFSEENPNLATTVFINGDQSTGFQTLQLQDYQVTAGLQTVATDNQTGAIWGLAYNKSKEILFASAVLRRHSGFGPEGIDAIYLLDFSSGGSPSFLPAINLTSLGVDVGTDPRTSALPNNVDDPNHDPEAFDLVGKRGIGDIELSEDGNTLYVMNLHLGTIVEIDITDINSPTLIAETTIPDPGCSNGDVRPWAIKVHKGDVYVGLVCDGSAGGPSDLHAFVQKKVGASFITEFDFPLDYDRTADYFDGIAITFGGAQSNWNVWSDNLNWGAREHRRGQPILSDIEFDIDGSLILLFASRNALRTGVENYSNDTGDNSLYSGRNSGEILRICNINGNYQIEGSAGCGFNFTNQAHRNFGLGEFIWIILLPIQMNHLIRKLV